MEESPFRGAICYQVFGGLCDLYLTRDAPTVFKVTHYYPLSGVCIV
jgi:hypothetical protein